MRIEWDDHDQYRCMDDRILRAQYNKESSCQIPEPLNLIIRSTTVINIMQKCSIRGNYEVTRLVMVSYFVVWRLSTYCSLFSTENHWVSWVLPIINNNNCKWSFVSAACGCENNVTKAAAKCTPVNWELLIVYVPQTHGHARTHSSVPTIMNNCVHNVIGVGVNRAYKRFSLSKSL